MAAITDARDIADAILAELVGTIAGGTRFNATTDTTLTVRRDPSPLLDRENAAGLVILTADDDGQLGPRFYVTVTRT